MKTLVTGATGFLGATLARRLVHEGVRVRCIRRGRSNLDLVGDAADDIEWITADVLDTDALEKAVTGISTVYHCAAYLGFDGKKDRERLMAVNVRGTANVVHAAIEAGVERLVHTSSIAALSRKPGSSDCLDESAEWRKSPRTSAYGESKYLAELEVQRGIAEGLDAVIVNPSLVMGVGRSGENTMLLVDKIRRSELPFMPIGSTNVVDVLDVVSGHLHAMEKGLTGERYLLTGENLSWSDVITSLADALNVAPPKRTISPGFMHTVAIFFELAARITRQRPLITREAARLSSSTRCYTNRKAKQELGCTFRPFQETAHRIAVGS